MIAFLTAVAGAIKIAAAAEKSAPISPFGPLNTGLISIMITLLLFAMKNQIANRKMTIQVNGEVRSEFIEEMQALRLEVKGLRDENVSLRGEVRELHGVIDGMRREALQAGISTQRAVAQSLPPGFVPPATQEALNRMKETPQ